MSETESRPEGPLTASVERLRQELDHWLNVAVSQGEWALDRFGLRDPDRAWTPSLDLFETAEDIQVLVDLPGIDPRSIDITLAGNMLTLKGEKASLQPAIGQTLHACERHHGPFARSIPLPAPVDPDGVSAETKNGTLQIRLMKADRAKARQIQVKVEEESPIIRPPEGG